MHGAIEIVLRFRGHTAFVKESNQYLSPISASSKPLEVAYPGVLVLCIYPHGKLNTFAYTHT